MRIMIVEDSTFNAFCLAKVLQSVNHDIQVNLAHDDIATIQLINTYDFSLIIMDGDLGDAMTGPELLSKLWSTHPNLPIVAWTDSETIRQSFAEVFAHYNKPFNEHHCWAKLVHQDTIRLTLLPFENQTIV